MSDTAQVSTIPQCDICHVLPAVYDAKTVYGPWAYLCDGHFHEIGPGRLGTGFGQRLVLREGAAR